MFRLRCLLIFFVFSFLTDAVGHDEWRIFPPHKLKFEFNDYFLPKGHPLHPQLNKIFEDKDFSIFNSPQDLRLAGFLVLERVHRGLMVAAHPDIPKFLFKKFQNDVDQESQLRNFQNRIQGARNLLNFIKKNRLNHIVTPKKWLYLLPKRFSSEEKKRAYLLIVEKIDICPGGNEENDEVAQCYRRMNFEILKELCTVVYYFRGLDSKLHNMPFTRQGQIAFIDTERWSWKREGYLKQAIPFLNHERREYARFAFEELQAQDKR